MSSDSTFLQARIDATEAQIIVYEAALTAFGASNIQQYDLDTGQDRQRVTRADLGTLKRVLDSLYNTRATLQARLNGGASLGRPAW